MNENNVRIYEKFTKMECVSKIGFLSAPNVKFSNLKNYEKMIAEKIECEENEFELSRSNFASKERNRGAF